jgi:prepilin-type N-terminal cleavage/methylation domain-containing protein
MTSNRRGVTLLEVMVVTGMIAVLVAIGLPRMHGMIERASVNSARDQLISAISVARSTAIRRGTTATFNLSGSEMWVTSDSSGTEVYMIGRIALDSSHGVSVTAGGNTGKIQYNMRGLASNAAGRISITRGSRVDSICVTTLGAALKKGCL